MSWLGERQRHAMSARGVVSDFNKHNQWMEDAKQKQAEWKLKQQEHDRHRRTVITSALYDFELPVRSVQSVDVIPLFYRDGVEHHKFYAEITFDGNIKKSKTISSESPDDLDSTEGYFYSIRAEPKQSGLRMFTTFYVVGDVQAIPEIKKKIKKLHKELS